MLSIEAFTEEDRTQLPHQPTLPFRETCLHGGQMAPVPFPAVRGADSDGTVPQDTLTPGETMALQCQQKGKYVFGMSHGAFPLWAFILRCAVCL